MAISDSIATKRRQLVESINETLAEIEIASKRHQQALAEAGTAQAYLEELTGAYVEKRARLEAMLPPVVNGSIDAAPS